MRFLFLIIGTVYGFPFVFCYSSLSITTLQEHQVLLEISYFLEKITKSYFAKRCIHRSLIFFTHAICFRTITRRLTIYIRKKKQHKKFNIERNICTLAKVSIRDHIPLHKYKTCLVLSGPANVRTLLYYIDNYLTFLLDQWG